MTAPSRPTRSIILYVVVYNFHCEKHDVCAFLSLFACSCVFGVRKKLDFRINIYLKYDKKINKAIL
jgi:hypothetical protein